MVMEYGSVGFVNEDISSLRRSNIYTLGVPFYRSSRYCILLLFYLDSISLVGVDNKPRQRGDNHSHESVEIQIHAWACLGTTTWTWMSSVEIVKACNYIC